jgi:hypothetical protein
MKDKSCSENFFWAKLFQTKLCRAKRRHLHGSYDPLALGAEERPHERRLDDETVQVEVGPLHVQDPAGSDGAGYEAVGRAPGANPKTFECTTTTPALYIVG